MCSKLNLATGSVSAIPAGKDHPRPPLPLVLAESALLGGAEVAVAAPPRHVRLGNVPPKAVGGAAPEAALPAAVARPGDSLRVVVMEPARMLCLVVAVLAAEHLLELVAGINSVHCAPVRPQELLAAGAEVAELAEVERRVGLLPPEVQLDLVRRSGFVVTVRAANIWTFRLFGP